MPSGQLGTAAPQDGSRQTDAVDRPMVPGITLPKGGGAIRGMGEKFGTNPVTGTASVSVPIATSLSRGDFSPKLALTYDSGAGNGPFGFGWHLSVPAVARKTDKGLPRYWDDQESDVFVLSDAEDLVPSFQRQGNDWVADRRSSQPGYTVQRYRPRVEGLFARIERWRDDATGETFWKAVSRDNVTSLYGTTANSRVADPADPSRVFSWLLGLSYDDRGNVAAYEYKPEDSINVPTALHEQHRSIPAQRYLKRIHYGNRTPYHPEESATLPTDWCFELVFDYGEHERANPRPQEDTGWRCRPDPYSSYRAGFEVRTYRVCFRALMFHHFTEELGPLPYLVRSTEFTYSFDEQPPNPLNPIYSFLKSARQVGYTRKTDGTGYDSLELPPLDFRYTQAAVDQTIHYPDPASLEEAPFGVVGSQYQWVDLDSEGSPGILAEQGDGWFYKRNVSNRSPDGNGTSARFEPAELVATRPSVANLSGGHRRLMDLGDGQLSLVEFARPVAGFYERDEDGQWQPFRPFTLSPNVDWNDPNLRTVDLDGDGLADILITENDLFTWYPSREKDGFGPAETLRKPFDEEQGPALVFADGTQSVYLADMSGDGLMDIVRVRNGEVCYWPNLGYGRFGAKICMEGAPLFDSPELFDQTRIRLADVDGTGTADLIYLGRDTATLWFNQSGNNWSDPHQIPQFPVTDDVDAVSVVDLLGNGTACLVWSSPLPGEAGRPLRYINLLGGQKPHLLIGVNNNLGAETRVAYAASTRCYLQDRAEGNPWVTRLAFPVHVVERVESFDDVSKTKLVSTYRYHHGYFDGIEREFRGFGMVEQVDTESFSKFSGTGLFSSLPELEGEEFHLPPVRTKTWFHTGAFIDWDRISHHFAHEYYQGDSQAVLLPDSNLPSGLSADETREACRALKGRVLRTEVYADDGTPSSAHPYSVTEHTYGVRLIQPRLSDRYAVFFAHETQALAYDYERNPQDPRLGHQLTLEVDAFGNVVKAAAVGYPRRVPQFDEQRQTLITYKESDVVNRADQDAWYRIGLPVEARTYELTNVPHAGALYTVDEIAGAAATSAEIPYEVAPSSTAAQKRLIERARSLYLKDDLSASLPLGQVESLALPFQSYKQAFTPGLLTQVYSSKIAPGDLINALRTVGGYRDLDANGAWWIPTGRPFFSPDPATPDPSFARAHFYLPQGALDPFGHASKVTYDTHNLLPVRSEDAVQNIVVAQSDYRVLQPSRVTDPNGNRVAARFDALGMVTATAVLGKEGQNEGDTLDDPTTRLEYDLFNWKNNQRPIFVHTFAREQHGTANPRWQESYSYSDGNGREAMKKVQAEPGQAPQRDASGQLEHDANGKLLFAFTPSRWVGTGRTAFDNKGNPIKKYEPFFDSTPAYEDERELVQWGVTPILRYDPLGRLIRTDLPDGTFSTVEFDPWRQVTSDQNDTVRQSRWYADLGSPDPTGPEPTDPQRRAAWLAAKHSNTPAVAHFDTLGRIFLTIADNGPDGQYETRVELDIEGNQRSVSDALQRKVMTYDYDMLSDRIHQLSMDAGERWILNCVDGQPLLGWDSRDHQLRHEYDALRRPMLLHLKTGTTPEKLVERVVYGEGQPNDVALNLRGRSCQQYDGAGVVTNTQYDFKGNLLSSTRQLLQDYKSEVDWSQSPLLESEVFSASTTYDALNRPTTLTSPDSSIIRPIYNEANLLERMSVNLRGAATATPFVTNFDYNAKGQRELVEYANRASTTYSYDPSTFRLTRLRTTRSTDNVVLQDLSYTYDPVGNITQIADAAQSTVYFNNAVVDASNAYAYDAIYRLTHATGREHIGQVGQPQTTWDDGPRIRKPLPGDGQAMRTYAEDYRYDAVGNIFSLAHTAFQGNWTRLYAYNEPSLIEPTRQNNRLSNTSVGAVEEPYAYDTHGDMVRMPHLPLMQWNYRDELAATSEQVVNDGTPETTWYVYDAAGQRVRKVTERQAAAGQSPTRVTERVYVGGFEVFREYDGAGVSMTLERESLHVMDDKQRIALVETRTAGSDLSRAQLIRDQFSNHLGSAALELDDQAQIISYEEYNPYGGTSYQSVRSQTETPKRYRYTSKERDAETGFTYHGARYYAPWLGRWTNCDRVAGAFTETRQAPDPTHFVGPSTPEVQATSSTTGAHATHPEWLRNLFAFSNNSPLVFVDLDGNDPVEIAWKVWKGLSAGRNLEKAAKTNNLGSALLYVGSVAVIGTSLSPIGIFLSGWAAGIESQIDYKHRQELLATRVRELLAFTLEIYLQDRLRSYANSTNASALVYSLQQRSAIEKIRERILDELMLGYKGGSLSILGYSTLTAADREALGWKPSSFSNEVEQLTFGGVSFGEVYSPMEHVNPWVDELKNRFAELDFQLSQGHAEVTYGPPLPVSSLPPASVEVRGLTFPLTSIEPQERSPVSSSEDVYEFWSR